MVVPVFPALRKKQRQADFFVFKASVVNKVRTYLKNKNQNKTKIILRKRKLLISFHLYTN